MASERRLPTLAVFMFGTVYWDGDVDTTDAVFQHFLNALRPCFERIDLCVPVVYSVHLRGREPIDESVLRVMPMTGIETGIQRYGTRFPALVRDCLRLFFLHRTEWDLVLVLDGDIHSQFVALFTRLFGKNAFLHLRQRYDLLGQWSRTNGLRTPAAALFRRWLTWSIREMTRHMPTVVVGEELYDLYREGARGLYLYVSSSVRLADLPDAAPDLAPLSEPVRLLTVGRVAPIKGLNYLLAAVAKLRHSYPVILRVVGPAVPGHMLELERLVAELGLGDAVDFVGPVPFGPCLDALYRAADLYVHSALIEGTPKVVTEAMSHGLPVVATHVGGIPQLVADGVTGYLVPPADPGALSEAVARVLSDDAVRRDMGAAGFDRVREFTLDAQLRGYVDFLAATFPELNIDSTLLADACPA